MDSPSCWLTDRAGLTPAAISQLEANERLPAFKTLRKLADSLQTSVSFLLGEDKLELPPELKAFFRDLEDLGAEDIAKVREYTSYLRFQSRSHPG